MLTAVPEKLDAGSIVAIASALLSILAAVISGVMANRSRKLEHALELQRRKESKAEQTEELISKYREPLLLAAHSLQQRMHNGIGGGYLEEFLHCGDPEEERYARRFTIYTLAEYLCWVEIIRRDLQFLDLGDEGKTRSLNAHLTDISSILGSQRYGRSHFRIFRGRQRAIGQLMMDIGHNGSTEALTYPEFDVRIEEDSEFRRWFTVLLKDVDAFLTHDWNGNRRQIELQWALIDLIDFLDPGKVRIPHDRAKLEESDIANRVHEVPR